MNNANTVHRVKYKWKIEHCSFYLANGIRDFNSPVFCGATERAYKWRLKFDFNDGNLDPDYEHYLGLFLQMDSTGITEPIFAKFKFVMLNDKIEVIQTHVSKICKFQRYGDGIGRDKWGEKHFFCGPDLLDDEILPNDTLTVICEILFSKGNNFIDDFEEPNSTKLQISKYTLSENFGSLFTNQNYSDVVLSVKGKKYHVHKYILAARSAVFDAMFKHNMIEKESSCIEITDMDEKVAEEMLRYIYTDKFNNAYELAEALFVAADKYDLRGLKLECEEILFKNLTVEDATKVLIMADMYAANELKSNTISFIVANSKEVVETATWNDMVVSHPKLFNEVFKTSLY